MQVSLNGFKFKHLLMLEDDVDATHDQVLETINTILKTNRMLKRQDWAMAKFFYAGRMSKVQLFEVSNFSG